ncbi:subtilisin family serine protease [Microbacterium testaceum]|nr:subtilisin family serine protease [Microbacterium testaceum]
MKRAAAAVASVIVMTLLSGATAMPAMATTVPASASPQAPTNPVPEDPTDSVRAGEYWIDQYGVREAWKTTRGAGQKIAVIDTGIGRGPAEFNGAVVGGTDVSGVGASDGRTPVGAVDANHGSWVGSLAAARGTGNGRGMIGVAPEAELLSISVGFGASSAKPFTDQIADAIRWAVDNGATVINMSLTTNTLDWDTSWDTAFEYAFDHDVVIVVAAGNRGSGTDRVGAPATIPGVLAVGGVDPTGAASNDASTQGITIGLSAPSERLIGVSADGSLVQWNGTSGAAPIVARYRGPRSRRASRNGCQQRPEPPDPDGEAGCRRVGSSRQAVRLRPGGCRGRGVGAGRDRIGEPARELEGMDPSLSTCGFAALARADLDAGGHPAAPARRGGARCGLAPAAVSR